MCIWSLLDRTSATLGLAVLIGQFVRPLKNAQTLISHVQDQVGPGRRVLSTEHGFWWLSIVKPLKAMLSGNAPNGYRLRLAISNENWFHKTERYECGECDDFV